MLENNPLASGGGPYQLDEVRRHSGNAQRSFANGAAVRQAAARVRVLEIAPRTEADQFARSETIEVQMREPELVGSQVHDEDFAIDAQRTASERSALVCPECDAPPGTPHSPDCPMRPVLRYDDALTERYARGDASVFRVACAFVDYEELIEL